jgi:CelD/BcsL family acetyltransferase involved in cellulose biosynthesis
MQVREIDTIEEFDAARGDWDAAFAADPHASVFVSWAWMRGWLDVTPHPWTVLAARENDRSPFVAFLPISIRGSRSPLRLDQVREIHMAGEPTADYTGFVCSQRTQQAALQAFAEHFMHTLRWDRVRFKEVNDPRLPLFLAHIPAAGLSVMNYQGTPCPRMRLPDTWEAFVQGLSAATRQSLRKRMRSAEKAFRLTRSSGVDAQQPIDALMQMAVWRTRDDPDPHTWRLHSMLRRCAMDGAAHVLMLWKDQTPVAGVGGLIDRKGASLGVYVTSFNEDFADFSPGRVAVALAIRDAIEMRLKVFDFLRGEEPYKFQFGAESRHNRTALIERHSLQTALRRSVSGLRERLRM